MSHASLAARYRPQTFAEVLGQDAVKAVLSRSAAADKVAPAYLLSGTRGVGKTTLARIFAKALNCEHAPAAEPCCECAQCRRVAQGTHVDVIEIDGASNRGVDDARRLREAAAYAPMEGRYKVFIVDEAHMLTRESFNALLKTLEEPPARVVFVLATTEAHKFPITIVSRCQHLVFKALPEAAIAGHLSRVLTKEGIPFEEKAVRLLARRAAGSVRDALSLLGQALALGGENLAEATTRDVLGLAGREAHEKLLTAFLNHDCVAVAETTKELLGRGVDIGFFLRELSDVWRNLFLILQAGPAAAALLDLPEEEKARLVELAPKFDLAYAHAAWQMTLESQRQVLTSLEPASALELLLLNLAILPRLVSLERLSQTVEGAAASAPKPEIPAARPAPKIAPMTEIPAGPRPAVRTLRQSAVPKLKPETKAPAPQAAPEPEIPEVPAEPEPEPQAAIPAEIPEVPAEPEAEPQTEALEPQTEAPEIPAEPEAAPKPEALEAPEIPSEPEAAPKAEALAVPIAARASVSFREFCETAEVSANFPMQALKSAKGAFSGDRLSLEPTSSFQREQLLAKIDEISRLASAFLGRPARAEVLPASNPARTGADLRKQLASHPLIAALSDAFDASLISCVPLETARPKPSKKRKAKEKRHEEHE